MQKAQHVTKTRRFESKAKHHHKVLQEHKHAPETQHQNAMRQNTVLKSLRYTLIDHAI